MTAVLRARRWLWRSWTVVVHVVPLPQPAHKVAPYRDEDVVVRRWCQPLVAVAVRVTGYVGTNRGGVRRQGHRQASLGKTVPLVGATGRRARREMPWAQSRALGSW